MVPVRDEYPSQSYRNDYSNNPANNPANNPMNNSNNPANNPANNQNHPMNYSNNHANNQNNSMNNSNNPTDSSNNPVNHSNNLNGKFNYQSHQRGMRGHRPWTPRTRGPFRGRTYAPHFSRPSVFSGSRPSGMQSQQHPQTTRLLTNGNNKDSHLMNGNPRAIEEAAGSSSNRDEGDAGDREERDSAGKIERTVSILPELTGGDCTTRNNFCNLDMKMAEDKGSDLSQKAYFTVGSQIKCRFQGDDVEGQVAAFNHSDRILMIRSASSCGKSTSADFILINADCVDKISVEDPTPTENLKPVDFQKLEKRRQKLSSNKKSRIRALSAEVAPEARKLFLTIIKTIDEVTWDGDKILVLNEVRISPPYSVDDVQGDKEASVVHVKKIVDKHWKEFASNSASK